MPFSKIIIWFARNHNLYHHSSSALHLLPERHNVDMQSRSLKEYMCSFCQCEWESNALSMFLKTLFLLLFFSGYALELLNHSLISLQEKFTSTWGLVYFENAQVFSDLYQDLSDYYKGSTTNVNLEEVLNEFWIKLMEKLFNTANKPNSIGKIVEYQNMKQVKSWLNSSVAKMWFLCGKMC